MGYLDIIKITFWVLWGFFGLLLFHYIVFTIVGIFTKKKYPEAVDRLKYGIIIGARNEERVIGDLIDSIHRTDYPQDKLHIFVVAHNCTDRTAEICREKGATVYEYNNPSERTVGYAYKHLFEKINADYGWENFDGFFVINADNTMTENYFTKMNDAFVHSGKKSIITSYRNSENFGSNVMSCLYGIFFISSCRLESRGRTACGCSTRVSGTGYLFNSELIKDGWKYVTLTEDWEFTADQIACGNKVEYCDDAEFFDEQPTTIPVMLRQRLRWARGHMVVFFTRFKALMKSLFKPKSKGGVNKGSVYDFSASIMPLGVMFIALSIIQTVLIALSPLFGYNAVKVWTEHAIYVACSFGISYFICLFTGVLLVLIEHRRIPKVGFFTMLGALLLWPFFIALNVILDVIALFVKKIEWKVIPHGDSSREHMQAQQQDNTNS